jgi:hypothetical protein
MNTLQRAPSRRRALRLFLALALPACSAAAVPPGPTSAASDALDDLARVALEGTPAAVPATTGRRSTEAARQARKRTVRWAASIGESEEWVDAHFTFTPDGAIGVNGSLRVPRKASSFPEGMRWIQGDLDISNTRFTSLASLPPEIGGSLTAYDTQITSLRGMPREIGGNLDLRLVRAHTIPVGIVMSGGGHVLLNRAQHVLAADAKAKGYDVRFLLW